MKLRELQLGPLGPIRRLLARREYELDLANGLLYCGEDRVPSRRWLDTSVVGAHGYGIPVLKLSRGPLLALSSGQDFDKAEAVARKIGRRLRIGHRDTGNGYLAEARPIFGKVAGIGEFRAIRRSQLELSLPLYVPRKGLFLGRASKPSRWAFAELVFERGQGLSLVNSRGHHRPLCDWLSLGELTLEKTTNRKGQLAITSGTKVIAEITSDLGLLGECGIVSVEAATRQTLWETLTGVNRLKEFLGVKLREL